MKTVEAAMDENYKSDTWIPDTEVDVNLNLKGWFVYVGLAKTKQTFCTQTLHTKLACNANHKS